MRGWGDDVELLPAGQGRESDHGPGPRRPAIVRSVGTIVLGLSACGYPLTQVVMRRLGRAGAGVVEAVCAGLTIRDGALIVTGTPRRLRRGPAVLLWLELSAGIAATVTGLRPLIGPRPAEPATARPGALERARRTAVATLFVLHTIRFGIYLRPDQGRRPVSG